MQTSYYFVCVVTIYGQSRILKRGILQETVISDLLEILKLSLQDFKNVGVACGLCGSRVVRCDLLEILKRMSQILERIEQIYLYLLTEGVCRVFTGNCASNIFNPLDVDNCCHIQSCPSTTLVENKHFFKTVVNCVNPFATSICAIKYLCSIDFSVSQ